MKKFLPVGIGVLVGIVVSIAMVSLNQNSVAYGEDENVGWLNSVTSKPDWWSWQDVFDPLGPSEKAKDLYNLMYEKLNRTAENTALREVAKNYGLTTDEAKAVAAGTITPIFNNPDFIGTQLTQEEAATIMLGLQEDFEILNEMYQIQQEVDVATKPSEIFANDDLTDSGFDLVYDLSVIEEILFFEKTPTSVGGLYEDQQDKPESPVEGPEALPDYLVSETPAAALSLPLTAEEAISEDDFLTEDVCLEEDSAIADAVDDFENEADGAVVRRDAGEDLEELLREEEEEESVVSDSGLKSAPPSEWGEDWCPGLEVPGSSSGSVLSPEGFMKSLGGVDSPFLGAGASAGIDTAGFAAKIGLCLETKLIKKTVVSFQPGASCILCEVEKINELMDKTLSHSLIPNKVTGNLFESAKCKEAGSLFNMQFITIWNPVPTPANDELIFGKNIFEEWDSFTERYQPVLLNQVSFESEERPEQSDNFYLEFAQKSAPAGNSQFDLFSDINQIKTHYTTEAALQGGDYSAGHTATNAMLFTQSILGEIQQMNALFSNFKESFEGISGALQVIKSKPTKG